MTATATDRATVATLTDTIAQISSELDSAQAKLISSLLDNQKLIKRLSERGGDCNTSVGGAYRKTSGGGATGSWDCPSIHYCHTHGHKCPHPSFKCPNPAARHIKTLPRRISEGVRTKITKINDNTTMQIRTQKYLILIMRNYLNLLCMFVILIVLLRLN